MKAQMDTLLEKLEQGGLSLEELCSARGQGKLPLVAPETVEELAETLARAGEAGLRVLPVGLGGRLSWCRPEVFDEDQPRTLAISTRKLQEVLAYEPGDGTLTAQPGCRMESLAEIVASGGHRLTPDLPRPQRATLGGVIGAGQSGLERARFGPTRHHLLGMQYLSGEGKLIKTGGRLVKNVTGFDLHRLLCGARGTLGIAVEISLRLFPLPQRETLLEVSAASWQELARLADALGAREVPPNHLVLHDGSAGIAGPDQRGGWQLWFTHSGHESVVNDSLASTRDLLRAGDFEVQEFEAGTARARRSALRDACAAPAQWPSFRTSCFPSRLEDAASTLLTFAETRGWQLKLVCSPAVATIDVTLDERETDEGPLLARALLDLKAQLAAAEVQLQPMDLPATVCAALTPELSPVAQRWMSNLAHELDPHSRFQSTLFPVRRKAAEEGA